MWGISGRLNNTRQVPAPRAFVSDQTGLVEERRDGRELSHLCCFASRTQQCSSGALTQHRLLHGGAPFWFVCTPLPFQRSYSTLVASACASGHARDARGKPGPRPVASTWVTVLDATWEWPCSENTAPSLSPMWRAPPPATQTCQPGTPAVSGRTPVHSGGA